LSHYKLVLLIVLVLSGVAVQLSGSIDPVKLITVARQYAEHWWLAVLLVVIQTILFTFATAGSSMVWVSAALYPPLISTLIIAAGTTLGGISAYLFSAHLSTEWTHRVENSRIYRLLRNQGNFLTLLALRLMPGFPHSVINYSSGILKIKFINFIAATVTGTAIKTYVYSQLIYNATTPGSLTRSIDLTTVWPLAVLSLLILAAMFVKNFLE